jgi:hypothetical protein
MVEGEEGERAAPLGIRGGLQLALLLPTLGQHPAIMSP